MILDIKKTDWGVDAKTASEKWEKDFTLTCDTEEQLPYAEKCLASLDAMPADMERRLAKYLFRYYKDYEQYYEEDEIAAMGITEDNVLDHIRIDSLIVDDDCRQDRIEYHISGGCEWEEEHGLEIAISDGKILYVGPFEDYSPNSERLQYALDEWGYYDPHADPSMNYADKE